MKTIFAIFVLICCLSRSNATLPLIKAKINASPILQRAVQYLAMPEYVPLAYARPSYSTHVSSFSVSLPSVHHVGSPVAAALEELPHVHPTAYYAPGYYSQPFTIGTPQVYYRGLDGEFVEPYVRHFIEEHYDERYRRHLAPKGKTGRW